MVGETDFPASGKNSILHFSESPDSFVPSNRKVFFNEIFHSGWWKWMSWLVETVFVCSQFFHVVETVSKINGNQFLKKGHITNFWDSGNHFLQFSQTAVNCYQRKQFFI